VSTTPDPRRGERLIVLHDGIELSNDDILAGVAELPPLFRPRANDVYRVDALPVLGTGKLDLRGLKQLAEDLTSASV
ncbi:MAG: hypothetical protein ACYTF0_02325, partial [Planctomycetota bacterium]